MSGHIDQVNGKTYLTAMSHVTRMSTKGQVVIPKEVREALGMEPGQALDVLPITGGVLLRKPFQKSGSSTDEVLSRIRTAIRYSGPALPIDKLGFPSPEEWQAARDGPAKP